MLILNDLILIYIIVSCYIFLSLDIPYNNKRADKKGKETEQIHVFTNFPNPDDSEEDSAKTDVS